jgi:hypothetical protein
MLILPFSSLSAFGEHIKSICYSLISLSLYIYMEETDFFCKFVHPNRAISRTSHMPVCLLGMGVGVNGSCPTATGWDG